ncbi:MAG: hypothetical protein J07HR59_01119 [Halorubrum sp. J07HR59]|nr:MAG: hypothetical protein J07HR59_01119 [Halorubrum sp. J07HR59]
MPTALTLFSSDVGTFAPVPRLGSGSLPSALGVHRRATAAWSPTASHHPLSSRFLTRTHALVSYLSGFVSVISRILRIRLQSVLLCISP